MTFPLAVFWLLAALTVGSAALVVTRRSAVHAALFLVVTFMGVAGLYVLLEAEFVAAVQVLVYAGGIMVLFLFVIMLVDLQERGREPRAALRLRRRTVWLSLLMAVALVALLLTAFAAAGQAPPAGDSGVLRAQGGNLESVAIGLFANYVLPFELASVLLLVAMIGAVVLAKYRI